MRLNDRTLWVCFQVESRLLLSQRRLVQLSYFVPSDPDVKRRHCFIWFGLQSVKTARNKEWNSKPTLAYVICLCICSFLFFLLALFQSSPGLFSSIGNNSKRKGRKCHSENENHYVAKYYRRNSTIQIADTLSSKTKSQQTINTLSHMKFF